MTDGKLLERAICANPECQTLRGAFRDWLIEQNDTERLVLVDWPHPIRLHAGDVGVTAVRRQAPVTEATYFLGDRPLRYGFTTWTLDRGFLVEITLPCRRFVRHAAALFRTHPLTSVHLSDRYPRNFRWFCGNTRNAIPPELFKFLLSPAVRASHPPSEAIAAWISYENTFDALRDLDRACVQYGRFRAGSGNGSVT